MASVIRVSLLLFFSLQLQNNSKAESLLDDSAQFPVFVQLFKIVNKELVVEGSAFTVNPTHSTDVLVKEVADRIHFPGLTHRNLGIFNTIKRRNSNPITLHVVCRPLKAAQTIAQLPKIFDPQLRAYLIRSELIHIPADCAKKPADQMGD